MSKRKITRLSLAQHFEAPPGYVGEFGWVCGYSADAGFMDIAAERFMRLIAARRAAYGKLGLALLLDRRNGQLTTRDVPGVAHCLVKSNALPFRLLHAKVALLGYRNLADPNQWKLRLLVSTGNWTRGTLEENIDLVWRIEVDSEDLRAAHEETRRACADLVAAWGTISYLRNFVDTTLLTAVPLGREDTETLLAQRNLEHWIATVRAHARGRARYFDNRQQSLLAQVLRKIGSGSAVRNILAMGSGYFDGGRASAVPPTLNAIHGDLVEAGLLTKSAGVHVFVNRGACQSVAHAIGDIRKRGWTVAPPARPGNGMHFMHAKFLFSARYTEGSNRCSNPWVYLGSGNLTGAGFTKRASAQSGNFEAGVVLMPEELYWTERGAIDPAKVVTNLLPLQWDEEIESAAALQAGEGMVEPEGDWLAPPVSVFYWTAGDEGGGWLSGAAPAEAVPFQVLDLAGRACAVDPQGRFRWDGARPREVAVQWSDADGTHKAMAAVMDEYGRVAAGDLAGLGLDLAGWELASFPAVREDSNDEDDGDGDDPEEAGKGAASPATSVTKPYPIRQMMQLIEQIAEKQCALDALDWGTWCHRLEQVLIQACGSAPVAEFRKLNINPLSVLYVPAFRPAYAESRNSEAGMRYEQVLSRVEHAWAVKGLPPIGEPA